MLRLTSVAAQLGTAAFSALAITQGTASKPRVPAGVDPGGVTVAIIGNGIDYTKPAIVRRLARDGEGELVGWDFIDEDRRPFEACAAGAKGCAADLVVPLTEQPARLVVLKAATTAPQTLVRAMQLAAQVNARVVLLGLEPPAPAIFLTEAAVRFPNIAIIGRVEATEGKPARGTNHLGLPANADESGSLVIRYGAAAVRCATQAIPTDALALLTCAERALLQ